MPRALALTEEEYRIYAENNIYFYDPNGCYNSTAADYAQGASSFGGLSANQVGFVEAYHDIAVMHSINYGIPWETVMAQGILESAAGTSYFAINRNNFFGIGAFDSNPDNAFSYATPEEGWEGYYRNIQRTSTYRNHGVFAGETVTNPYAYLVAIKEAGYATDPNYVDKVSRIIGMIEDLSRDRGWKLSTELASEFPEWLTNAEANSQGAGSESSTAAIVVACATNIYNSGSYGDGSLPDTLKTGGMTLEEARNFMAAYAAEANKMAKGDFMFDGALITDNSCPSGTMNNCSAFTQWFLNKYTNFGPRGAILHMGANAVWRYLSENTGLIDGRKQPEPYAIMSYGRDPGTGSSCGDGWCNHTGIVLGINRESDQIIIGEASCGMDHGARWYAPRAQVYKLSKYTNSSSKYGPTYAYTRNILKGSL
ncbi:glucosaminidase domain-containing protein [Candidatus Saccharibacteria bacterium]|nr:glucosaminidase domain-containing protein [Candidatus Saccharibacteria bacterium]